MNSRRSRKFRRTDGRIRSSGQRFMTTLRPTCLGKACGFVVSYRELHPDNLRPRREPQSLFDDGQDMFGDTKNIDHVDRFGNVGQSCVDLLLEDRFCRSAQD